MTKERLIQAHVQGSFLIPFDIVDAIRFDDFRAVRHCFLLWSMQAATEEKPLIIYPRRCIPDRYSDCSMECFEQNPIIEAPTDEVAVTILTVCCMQLSQKRSPTRDTRLLMQVWSEVQTPSELQTTSPRRSAPCF